MKKRFVAKGQWIIIAIVCVLMAATVAIAMSVCNDFSSDADDTEPTVTRSTEIEKSTTPQDTQTPDVSNAENPSEPVKPSDAVKPTDAGPDEKPDKVTEPALNDVRNPTANGKVSFYGIGDNLIHGYVYMYAQSVAGGSGYDFHPIYEYLADDIKKADISFINQETPITGTGEASGYPNFNTPKEAGEAIVDLGFDVVNIATNHMLDKGTTGLEKHIAYWKSKPSITMLGGYENSADAANIRVIEKNGIKVAFLSFTYGTNGMSLSSSSDIYIPLLNEEQIKTQVALAKKAADAVIVSVHWGEDSSQTVSESQKKYAKVFAQCNVDAVVGHHSHTLLPVEWISRQDGQKMLCIYSLGNAVSRMLESHCLVGGAINFDIEVKNGAVSITNVLLEPVVTHYNSSKSIFRIYYFKDYSQELFSQHGYEKYKTTYASMKEKIKKNVSAEFLSDFYK